MVARAERSENFTRTNILDAAERLFANRGFRGASVKEIAAEAGVTGAMINYYFENKQKLYHSVLDRIVSDVQKMVVDVLATGRPPAERLEIFFGWFFDYAAQHPNFAKLTRMGLGGSEKEHIEKIVLGFFKPMFQVGCGFFDRDIELKDDPDVDTEHLLLSIFGMTIHYFSDARFVSLILGRDALSKEELARRKECLLQIVFRMVNAERADLG
jgi:TetR/AcrR family transcriptional regulator